MKKRSRKTFYVSFNRMELDKLETISHREVVMYLTLKRLASFDDGWVGTFGKQRLTYEELAQKISRPASQGKPADTYDRKEAQRIVQQLVKDGLVSNTQVLGERLVMCLPLSPIAEGEGANPVEKDATPESPAGASKKGKLPPPESVTLDADFFRDHEECDFEGNSPPNSTAQPVMTVLSVDLSKSIPLSNDRCPDRDIHTGRADERPAVRSFIPEKGEGEKPEEDEGELVLTNGEWNRVSDGLLTVEEIERALAETNCFSFVTSERSRQLYERWVRFKVRNHELLQAIERVIENPNAQCMPDEVNLIIQAKRSSSRTVTGVVL